MALAVVYGASGDVRAELGSPSELEVSASDILRGRSKATNVINLYIGQAYPSKVPFSSDSIPESITEIANDLSTYFIKRFKHPGPTPLSEDVKKEYYEDNIKLLELIRDGKLEIPELQGDLGDAIQANRADYTTIFDLDETEEHIIDNDLKDHISDNRT